MLALVARYRGDFTEARKLLESVHLESPANLRAVIELAVVLNHIKGNENLSLQYAQVAVKLQPDLRNPGGRGAAIILAHILSQYGGEREAQQIVAKVLAAGSISNESAYLSGMILMETNRKAAKELLRQAVESERYFPGYKQAKDLYENTVW